VGQGEVLGQHNESLADLRELAVLCRPDRLKQAKGSTAVVELFRLRRCIACRKAIYGLACIRGQEDSSDFGGMFFRPARASFPDSVM
jgi:hypothetical protein